MSPRVRIVTALAAALAIATGMFLYAEWPIWFGREILVPITAGSRGGPNGSVVAYYPEARLRLNTSHTMATTEKQDTPRIDVRSIGVVLDDKADPAVQASSLRTRSIYLQMKPVDTAATNGQGLWRPESVSFTPVPDAVNLRADIRSIDGMGQIDVSYAPDVLPVPTLSPGRHMAAILKILPSGRAAIVGVFDGNQRRQF